MAKKSAVRVTPSTGNVFRDLGFPIAEAEHLLVRADLLIQVQKAIAARGLKQADAAKTLVNGARAKVMERLAAISVRRVTCMAGSPGADA